MQLKENHFRIKGMLFPRNYFWRHQWLSCNPALCAQHWFGRVNVAQSAKDIGLHSDVKLRCQTFNRSQRIILTFTGPLCPAANLLTVSGCDPTATNTPRRNISRALFRRIFALESPHRE